jgi:hypothetical protein
LIGKQSVAIAREAESCSRREANTYLSTSYRPSGRQGSHDGSGTAGTGGLDEGDEDEETEGYQGGQFLEEYALGTGDALEMLWHCDDWKEAFKHGRTSGKDCIVYLHVRSTAGYTAFAFAREHSSIVRSMIIVSALALASSRIPQAQILVQAQTAITKKYYGLLSIKR